MTRSAPRTVAIAIAATAALGMAGPAAGAPPTKRCIDAAESGQQMRGSGSQIVSLG